VRIDMDTRRRLGRARDLLAAADDAEALRIAEVARRVGVSPFHFIRVFEAAFGVTPHQYRIGARIDRARRLLAEGSSVTDACMAVGFSSLGSFSAMFAHRVGEPPSSYRRRVRASVQVPADLRRIFMPSCFSLMGLLPADAFRKIREA
jgi:AraC-like DNA-binding protein